jgi:hypothetical protein
MARQLNFYMLPEDENRFLDFATSINEVKIIFSVYNKPGLQVIDNFQLLEENNLYSGEILIWDQRLKIEPEYIKARHFKKYDDKLGEYRETGEVDYFIDKWNAPVIEFGRSRINPDGVLLNGRIWVELYVTRDNSSQYKGKQLEDLYSQLAKWLRKNFQRVEGYRSYFGKQALDWFKSGRQLVPY